MSSDSDPGAATPGVATPGVATVDPAHDRLVDHLDTERRAGRTVVTLVDLSRATSLDPRTVERVIERLAADPRRGVRRSVATPLRWYLRPPDGTGDDPLSE